MHATHYEHSGKAPLGGVLTTLVGGLAAGVVLGIVYAMLIYWIPFVYVNFFVTLGCGLFLGIAVGGLAKFGKIRNSGVVAILGLIVCLAAYYAHWVTWFELYTEERVTDPGVIWALLKTLAALGPWSIFGWTPTGFAMWAIWGIEAAMIIGLGTLGAVGMIDTPFCEKTGKWATDETLPVHFQPIDSATLVSSPSSLLDSLQPAANDSVAYAEVTIATVDGSDLRCVSLDNVTVETDKEGKQDLKKDNVVRYMLFDTDSFERLKRMTPPAAA